MSNDTAPATEPQQPRTWLWENEADRVEPADVRTVTDDDGDEWLFQPGGLWRTLAVPMGDQAYFGIPWAEALETYGPLTEVVPPAQDGAR